MVKPEYAAPGGDADDKRPDDWCGSDAPRLADAEFGIAMWTAHHTAVGWPFEVWNPELAPAGPAYAFVKVSGRRDRPVEWAHRICRQHRIIERALRGNHKHPDTSSPDETAGIMPSRH